MTKRKLDVEVYVQAVNPAQAKELLATGTNYRGKCSARAIAAYRRQMEMGRWKIGAPIMLDEEHRLLDGFTRMTAVAEGSLTVDFIVLDGIPSSVVDTLDNNQVRKATAVLSNVCGVRAYASMMAGIIKGIVQLPYHPVIILNGDMASLYELYRPTVDWTIEHFATKAGGHVKIAVMVAFARAHLFTPKTKHEQLSRMAHDYIEQTWDAHSPLRLLSLYITRNDTSVGGGSQSDLYLRAARAIVGCLNGETISQLKAGTDPFPCESPFPS